MATEHVIAYENEVITSLFDRAIELEKKLLSVQGIEAIQLEKEALEAWKDAWIRVKLVYPNGIEEE